jgi:hypothetical protein
LTGCWSASMREQHAMKENNTKVKGVDARRSHAAVEKSGKLWVGRGL